MKINPVLSIVTPTMNRGPKLKENFSSVRRVSQRIPCEHIIVDNMSNDGTESLVKEYRDSVDFPVVYIREKDKGIYDAMNKGIRNSSGIWVHILNSDDQYSPDLNMPLLFNASTDDFDILACGIAFKGLENGDDRIWLPFYRKRLRHYAFPHPGIIIKRTFYMENGLYSTKYRIISDAVYGCDHYDHARIKILETVLVDMACDGVSSNETLQNYLEQLTMMVVHHHYPWSYKTIRTLKLVKKISRFLFASRFPYLTKAKKGRG